MWLHPVSMLNVSWCQTYQHYFIIQKNFTRFHGHFSDFATKSFTAEADLQANTQNKRRKTLDKLGWEGVGQC